MKQSDLDYRNIHAVVPQLDFVNYDNGFDNIVADSPVQLSSYATMGSIVKANGGKIAGGAFGMVEGLLHLGSGNIGYGIGKVIKSTVDVGAGVVDPAYLGTNQSITQEIQNAEISVWKYISFLRCFAPASGKIGDIVYRDGSCDELHCGNGHRFFDNGDYFEGLFMDGAISVGLYIWNTGMRYLGSFDASGHMNGKGVILYTDGGYYHGDLEQSNRHGYGTMWYTGGVYIGEWQNDMRHGDGILKLANGKSHEGAFFNDQKVN